MEKPWYFIQDTPGQNRHCRRRPPHARRPTEEVRAIKAQISESEETEKPKVNFEVGETVKINDGPFLNFSGVIEEIEPERGKLKVTVNIFGRNTPVELEYWQVEKGDQTEPISILFMAKKDYRTDQVADSGRTGQSGAAGRPRARPARREHHGVLQGIQRRDQGTGRHDHPGGHHGLCRTSPSLSSPSRRPPPCCSRRPPASPPAPRRRTRRRSARSRANRCWKSSKSRCKDLNATSEEAAFRVIAGTARSMGIEVSVE